MLSAGVVGATGLVCLVTPSISASMAGFALAFASTITGDLLFMASRWRIRVVNFTDQSIRSDALSVWNNLW